MIQVNELRIGNWVKFEGKQTPIHTARTIHYYHNGFEPIPLTEEWLIKYGFELNEGKHYQRIEIKSETDGRSNPIVTVKKMTFQDIDSLPYEGWHFFC